MPALWLRAHGPHHPPAARPAQRARCLPAADRRDGRPRAPRLRAVGPGAAVRTRQAVHRRRGVGRPLAALVTIRLRRRAGIRCSGLGVSGGLRGVAVSLHSRLDAGPHRRGRRRGGLPFLSGRARPRLLARHGRRMGLSAHGVLCRLAGPCPAAFSGVPALDRVERRPRVSRSARLGRAPRRRVHLRADRGGPGCGRTGPARERPLCALAGHQTGATRRVGQSHPEPGERHSRLDPGIHGDGGRTPAVRRIRRHGGPGPGSRRRCPRTAADRHLGDPTAGRSRSAGPQPPRLGLHRPGRQRARERGDRICRADRIVPARAVGDPRQTETWAGDLLGLPRRGGRGVAARSARFCFALQRPHPPVSVVQPLRVRHRMGDRRVGRDRARPAPPPRLDAVMAICRSGRGDGGPDGRPRGRRLVAARTNWFPTGGRGSQRRTRPGSRDTRRRRGGAGVVSTGVYRGSRDERAGDARVDGTRRRGDRAPHDRVARRRGLAARTRVVRHAVPARVRSEVVLPVHPHAGTSGSRRAGPRARGRMPAAPAGGAVRPARRPRL